VVVIASNVLFSRSISGREGTWLCGKDQREGHAGLRAPGNMDLPAMQVQDSPGLGQAQSQASARFPTAKKWIEDLRQELDRDAGPIVDHAQADELWFFRFASLPPWSGLEWSVRPAVGFECSRLGPPLGLWSHHDLDVSTRPQGLQGILEECLERDGDLHGIDRRLDASVAGLDEARLLLRCLRLHFGNHGTSDLAKIGVL
jgi:hypothetical protein